MFFTKYEDLCKSAKKTTTGVAAELGVAKSTVAYWRANRNVIPKQNVLIKIADYFGVSVDYLLSDEKNKPSTNEEELTVFNMEGIAGAHTVKINMDNFKQLNELIKEAKDLPPEKLRAITELIKNMK